MDRDRELIMGPVVVHGFGSQWNVRGGLTETKGIQVGVNGNHFWRSNRRSQKFLYQGAEVPNSIAGLHILIILEKPINIRDNGIKGTRIEAKDGATKGGNILV